MQGKFKHTAGYCHKYNQQEIYYSQEFVDGKNWAAREQILDFVRQMAKTWLRMNDNVAR